MTNCLVRTAAVFQVDRGRGLATRAYALTVCFSTLLPAACRLLAKPYTLAACWPNPTPLLPAG